MKTSVDNGPVKSQVNHMEPKKFMTKKERLAKKEEEKRLRLLQEAQSELVGVNFNEQIKTYKWQKKQIKRRYSAVKRIFVEGINTKTDLLDKEALENAQMFSYRLKESEIIHKAKVEWRAQHQKIKMVEDKKKRAKSESRDITIKYVDALVKASKEGDYLTS